MDSIQEVYLADLDQRATRQLTNFTYRQDIMAQHGFRISDYRAAWVGTDSLLVSVVHGAGDARKVETLVYDLAADQSDLLLDGFITVMDWDGNGQQLAFQTGSTTDAYQGELQGMAVLESGATHSGNPAQPELLPISTETCALDWSPDGQYLAYTTPSPDAPSYGCATFSYDIHLFERGDREIRAVEMGNNPPSTRLRMPIGWVLGGSTP